jgi:hypothetical protein
VRELVGKYQGEAEACKRHVLAADAVTADTRGLQQLVAAANYRAAINHTALLLEMYGQGGGEPLLSVLFLIFCVRSLITGNAPSALGS